jgi:hypothetical protein
VGLGIWGGGGGAKGMGHGELRLQPVNDVDSRLPRPSPQAARLLSCI